MIKLAHVAEDGREQPLSEHLRQTAELAEENAVELFKPIAHAIGLAHDIGKYAQAFQARLHGGKKRFEHSACGAIEYKELLGGSKVFADQMFTPMIEFCIACHHTGLQDGGSVKAADAPSQEGTMNFRITERRKREEYIGDCDYSSYKDEIVLKKPDFTSLLNSIGAKLTPENRADIIETCAFFTRYLFSCLTDADFIDTERFCSPDKKRGFNSDFETPRRRLADKLSGFTAETELQKARSRIQAQAYENANDHGSHISILNMPTGSGKTLCSLKLALDKVNSDKSKKCIIYVIPYTGIIEQTAREFEPIFKGCCHILQHHSNFSFEDVSEDSSTTEKLKQACENWDAPVIVTTAVQFFESLFHYRSSALRKLHNMADSVIVFDEIHTLPVECLQPCFRAVGHITKYLNSEAIFLSATMPDYSELFKVYAPDCKITHLITDRSDFGCFKKADFVNLGKVDFETIAAKALEYRSCLIITNTKKSAREMYSLADGNKYHLSTNMTPFDRSIVIDKIKRDLSKGKNITVVSTSLIEAGIDLDFETVFREINGLDSILQAGGRCNREGRRESGTVFVFETEKSNPRSDMRINAAKRLLESCGDISAPKCIERYYNDVFFYRSKEIKRNTIAADCQSPAEIPFRSFAEKFKLIKEETVGVIVPQNDDCRLLLSRLESGERGVIRSLQKYTVSLKCRGENSEFERALKQGVITQNASGVFVVMRGEYYDKETGLDIDRAADIIC
ncbi:MAG: CRISPR-associated helicase Cas3' [Oscillospiraceae bacterium]|nr:CRISPR-associated helicase Cas3' [Oscillospiraceae bacterium]